MAKGGGSTKKQLAHTMQAQVEKVAAQVRSFLKVGL